MFDSVSFGGVGDAFMVALKLNKLKPKSHTFVESNRKTLVSIKELLDCLRDRGLLDSNIEFKFEFNPYYQSQFVKYAKLKRINTTHHGRFHEPSDSFDELPILKKDFLNIERPEKREYDVVIQNAAGINNTRKWGFGVALLNTFLQSNGVNSCVIGTGDIKMPGRNIFIGKTSLSEALSIIDNSKVFVGMSGLFNYYCAYSGLNNVFCKESDAHNDHYYSDDVWRNTISLNQPSVNSVIAAIKLFKIDI